MGRKVTLPCHLKAQVVEPATEAEKARVAAAWNQLGVWMAQEWREKQATQAVSAETPARIVPALAPVKVKENLDEWMGDISIDRDRPIVPVCAGAATTGNLQAAGGEG